MRLLYRKGCVVSEKEPKLPPLEPSSSLPASGLPASDRSLERVLGAIDKAIQSFTAVMKMVHDEVTSQGKLNMARHEMAIKLLGKMRVELATLADQLRDLLTSNNIQLGATVEARDALVRTREKLEEAAQDMQDATGQHAAMVAKAEDAEGDAPKPVRAFAAKAGVALANFVWPEAVRTGKDAAKYALKMAFSGGFLGVVAKVMHMIYKFSGGQ